MVTRIDYYPLSSGIVELSVSTTKVDGQVSTVKAWLIAMEALQPTAKDYTETYLVPEIISRAGLDEETTFSAVTELDYVVVDGRHLYTMQLDVSSGN